MPRSLLFQRALVLLFIVALSFAVRALTANFIRNHLNDPSWFQSGSYAVFDGQAQAILDRREPVFWINDATRTDRVVYPPGYPLWIAFVYKLSGVRSPVALQRVQVLLDSLAVLLIVGIGVSAFDWRVGMIAGILAALSPLLALAGATPNADSPTNWFVLGGVWCLVIAFRKQKILVAIFAGVLLGVACWLRVNPLFLFVVWAIALAFLLPTQFRRRLLFAGAIALATLLTISPVVIRNLLVFYPQVAPTGLGVGWNLLAGIGETNRGPEFGAPASDTQMIEQDRRTMNLPADAPLGLFYPDGIRRDRERGRLAVKVIAAHPIWYAGVIARRAASHLKLFGKPLPNLGSAGINVTSQKSLPDERQGGVVGLIVNIVGILQSLMRWIILPFMLIGIVIAWRKDWRVTALLLATVLYYLFTLAIGHSELRYGLPMQSLLLVFAAITLSVAIEKFPRGKHRTQKTAPLPSPQK
jgi:4-amino-4-deoxy-L-arabinose transferase-like glycosyltransferase